MLAYLVWICKMSGYFMSFISSKLELGLTCYLTLGMYLAVLLF